jgi:hypothetical protein
MVPTYHFLTFGILVLNLLFWGRKFWLWHSWNNGILLAVAVALILLHFHARMMALTVQDRVIRLEETLRMEKLLPDDLRKRIPELERGQIVSLRFASDEELPELMRKVLDEKITNRDAIKKMIRSWRADHFRC